MSLGYTEKQELYGKLKKILEIVLKEFQFEACLPFILNKLWENDELLEKINEVLLK